jgi:hypothetical protein
MDAVRSLLSKEPGMITFEEESIERRKEIFLALVKAQDQGLTVVQSRKLIIEQFAITDRQLRRIEEEGMEKEWPPL